MTWIRSARDHIVGPLVQLAGGRAAVVLPLARAMDRAALGQVEILREKSKRKMRLSARHLRLLFLLLVVAMSLFLSLTMLVRPEASHPPPGVVILVSFHWLLVLNMVVGQAGPALLVDEDHQVIGAWPVTRREIVLARLGTVLRPAFQFSLAAAAAPLVVYLVVGRPPVLPALALLVGLTVQTVGVAFGVTAALMALVRLLGRRRAQRMAAMVADGNFAMLGFFMVMFVERFITFVQAHPKVLLAMPPAWFSAWGDLAAGRFYWMLAGVGLLTSLAAVWLAMRLLSPTSHAADPAPMAGRPSRWNPAGFIAGALGPAMRGREGWVVRRLLEAHLRDDGRFVGGMAVFPVMMAFMFFSPVSSRHMAVDLQALSFTALSSVRYSHMPLVLSAGMIFTMSFSSQPQALWLVALGDLDVRRIMAAQRTLIRSLITVPMLVMYGWRALDLGASVTAALVDTALLLVQVEIIVVVLQPFVKTMPFSQAISRDHGANRIGLALLMGVVAVVFILLNQLYARFLYVRIGTWVSMPVLWFVVRHWANARLTNIRLRMDAVRAQ